ncbi:hypothetical protein BD289DRAFT_448044 [Coniella lustricola]|uniref:t-SNARE coiled-coil homology domain-containing protein n=1 Tax=Coniella lustricola TaxID=2025994 RepID=A0A2T2ZSH8_9PEZI|nr:hypothetical protein BD289DRAFT_448044 [Coniella lustricola]
MDVTPSFNELLKARQAPSTRAAAANLTLDQIDGFLKTASTINREIATLHHELSTIRQAYLSTAAPRKTHQLRRSTTGGDHPHQPPAYLTDTDRNVIDRDAKDMLRALSARINVLTQEEIKRQETAAAAIRQTHARGLRAWTSWAAGGEAEGASSNSAKSPEHAAAIEQERQMIEHRGGVIVYLQQKLQLAATLQRTMMETRLAREMEKNRSVLAKAGAGGQGLPPSLAKEFGFGFDVGHASSNLALDEEKSRAKQATNAGLDLTEEQKQMFERDNQDMLKHYNKATEKVRAVESSLIEIAELQQMLVENLTVQSANIEQLVADSERTEENVGGGNKQLKKATQRKFSQARLTFYAASVLCTFLVVWDLVI